jgi:transglutaminase-like putative cysteine protease
MVRLKYKVELNYDVFEPSDFIFNICAAHTPQQKVVAEKLDANVRAVPTGYVDRANENRHIRLHADPGFLKLSYAATVDIDHYLAEPETLQEVPVSRLPALVLPYIYPSRYCQSDALCDTAIQEFGHLPKGYERVDAIRQWVQERTKFSLGSTTSTTSAVDTLTQQHGVCRDFAHLMIALCRALNIPARFATGLDYGADPVLGPPDFHAYVEAFLGERWYIFDPAGISPPMGLLRIGTARDAAEVSFATIFGQVKGHAPLVTIEAVEEDSGRLTVPYYCKQAVSTAALSFTDAQLARAVAAIPATGFMKSAATQPAGLQCV